MNSSKIWYVTGVTQGLGYLGRNAYNQASAKLANMIAELEEWKETTISANFQK